MSHCIKSFPVWIHSFTLVLFLFSTNLFSQSEKVITKDLKVINGISENSDLMAIQEYLQLHMEEMGLEQGDILNWQVTDDYSSRGIRHIYLAQTINNLVVEQGVANITFINNDSIVYVVSNLIAHLAEKAPSAKTPAINSASAIDLASGILELQGKHGDLIRQEGNEYVYARGSLTKEDINVTLRMYDTGESIRLAWKVSLYQIDGQHWWQLFIDAVDGSELGRVDWVNDAHSDQTEEHIHQSKQVVSPPIRSSFSNSQPEYNVFALPVESPNHGNRTVEVNPHDPVSSPFGWHDVDGVTGADYFITRGNNVYAYEDADADNIPGFSPDGGDSLYFNFPLNLQQAPSAYQDVAITNLFFACNRIHDILYHYGFDEQSGNFQVNNYGKGGVGGDELLAEAQDGSGLNNANFGTPNDGSNPRMQMFLWGSASSSGNILTVNSPGSVAGSYFGAEASFGPGLTTTPITAMLVLADDNTGVSSIDACDALVNGTEINGNIAVVERGNCSFVQKVQNAQNAGAQAVIVVNNLSGTPFSMGGTSGTINIPSIMISNVDGASLISAIANDTVVATLMSDSSSAQMIDGDFDNGIVLHEYGHGVSNRLTGGPSNSGCLNNDEQMGEGWSDFLSIILTMDTALANPIYRPIGTFAINEPVNGNGIRPAPYDTSFSVNSYTYADISNQGVISIPHGVGFVWATMLWDLTWNFIDVYGFDPNIDSGSGGNNMVLQLVLEGMKLQPCSPGFVDGRDAILMADQILYNGVNQCLIWETFAKRGLGASADQGSSQSRTDQIAAFDLPLSCQTAITAPSAAFSANTTSSCLGVVRFEDMSTNVPQGWLWDFGDGDTSTLQNPVHKYQTSGLYTVTLVVSNPLGSDTNTILNYIDISYPEAPVGQNGGGCAEDSILLGALASDLILWFDQSGTVIDTGSSHQLAPSDSAMDLYAVNIVEATRHKLGPVDGSIGGGGNHGNAATFTLNIDAETEVILHSALVNPTIPGVRRIGLWEGHNGFGNLLQTIEVDMDFTGWGRVDLGFRIPGPGKYSIGLDSAFMFRNNSGTNYPYAVQDLISIVGSSASTADFYYYFYDIEVSEPDCISDTTTISSAISHSDFGYDISEFTVAFSDSSNGVSSWHWDFGDGDSSSEQNPSHTYAKGGVYTVQLTTDNACTVSYQIEIDEFVFDPANFSIKLFPNPASEEFKVEFNQALGKDGLLYLYGIDGKVLRKINVPTGSRFVDVYVENLAAQFCFMVFTTEGVERRMKVMVE